MSQTHTLQADLLETTLPASGVSEKSEAIWRDAFRRLDEFSHLPENWDSYGAKPISVISRKRAGELLHAWRHLTQGFGQELPEPFVAPCGDGRVQIEWSVGERHLEIEVSGVAETSQVFTWVAEQETEEDEDYATGHFADMDGKEARDILRWLFGDR